MSTDRLRRSVPRWRSSRSRQNPRPTLRRCSHCGGRQGFCCCQFLLWAQQVVISDPFPPRYDQTNPPRLDFSMIYDHHEISMRPLVFDRPTINLSKISRCLDQGLPTRTQCAVCLDYLDETSNAVASLCGGVSGNTIHSFHGSCLAESTRHVWENDMTSKCPLCRSALSQDNLRLMNNVKIPAATAVAGTVRQNSVETLPGNVMQLVREICGMFSKRKCKLSAKPAISFKLNVSARKKPFKTEKAEAKKTTDSEREAYSNRIQSSKLTERLIHNQLMRLRSAAEETRRARKDEKKLKKKDKKKKPHRRYRGHRKGSNA